MGLLSNETLTQAEYSALAIAWVYRATGQRLRPTRKVSTIDYGLATNTYVDEGMDNLQTAAAEFGPYAEAFRSLHDETDQPFELETWDEMEWNRETARVYRIARAKLRGPTRLALAFEEWIAEKQEDFPWLATRLPAALTALLGYVAGLLTPTCAGGPR